MKNEIPIVAIVGRQNVGKSSLLNALARRRVSIVDAAPGVTRDRVSSLVTFHGRACELVDTGGIGMARDGALREDVDRQIEHAIQHADAVCLVVDAKDGLMPLDRDLAVRLRKSVRDVILVVNKVDHPGRGSEVADFAALGLGMPIALSAVHRRNLDALTERLAENLPGEKVPPEADLRIAVVGRRNVGKSTYINALCGEERVIVSETPGTTRDAVDVRIERDGGIITLIDTAGMRKKNKVADSVELFSRDRVGKAIRRSDVVLLFFDVTERVAEVDKRLGGAIEDAKTPSVVVLNKWDRVPDGHDPSEFLTYLGKAMPVLLYAPVAILSAKEGDRIQEPIDIARELHEQAGTRVPTPLVNRAIQHAQNVRAPGSRGGRRPRIYYATQTGVRPPSFAVFVNDPRAFTPDYIRYLENKFREILPFREVPIRMSLRRRR